MINLKNKLVKRILAFALSGAMVVTSMASPTLTANAAKGTDTGYSYEVEVENSEKVGEDAKTVSDQKDEEGNEVVAEPTKEEDEEAVETTVADEDNQDNSALDSTKDNTATETTEADKDDVDSKEDDKTSETKSSSSAEVEEAEPEEKDVKEKEDKNEDVREFQAMESGATYWFSAGDMEAFASEEKSDGEEILLKGTKISGETTEVTGNFALICGAQTEVVSSENTFYCWDRIGAKKVAKETILQCINLNGELSAQKNAIKFTTAAASDVTVYWVGSEADSQMSILKDGDSTAVETDEQTVENGLYVSTVTLDTAGTYYLGGNNPIYKVIVEPASTEQTRTGWNFRKPESGGDGFPEFDKDGSSYQAFQKCATEYYGLKVDTNAAGGKFSRRDNDIQVGKDTVIRIPVEGRSSIVINTYYGQRFTLDGIAATVEGQNKDEPCVYRGNGKYAELIFTNSDYLNTITVKTIKAVKVSGSITLPDGAPGDLKLVFTEDIDSASKHVAEVAITGNTYEVELYPGASYKISTDKEGYGIKTPSPATIEIEENATTDITNKDIEVESQDLKTISGTIKFPDGAEIPNDLKLKFTEKGTDNYEEVTVSGGKYEVKLKADTTYTVDATGTKINEYEWDVTELTVTGDSNESHITFSKKNVYKVTLSATSFDEELTKAPTPITFTHEDGYEYKFTNIDNILLRNGTYTITEMDVEYPYFFDFSKTFEVEDTEAAFTLNFSERMSWDFTTEGQKKDRMLQKNKPNENASGEQSYHGLLINTNGSESGKFGVDTYRVQVNTGTKVKIPVSGKGTVKITPATGTYTLKALTEKDQDVSGVAGQTGSITYTEDNVCILFEATGLVWLEKIEITRQAESEEDGGSSSSPESGETDQSIERPETFPTEWNFRSGGPYFGEKAVGYEGKTGTLDGLYIDATNGKFSTAERTDWAQVNTGTIIDVPVKGPSEITLEVYAGTKFTIDGVEDVTNYTYKGEAGYVRIEITNGGYLGYIKVKAFEEVIIPTGPRKIDVWDFGGKEETDTDKYENHITIEKWISANANGEVIDTTKSNPVFTEGETSFGDLTFTHTSSDRLYSTLGKTNADFNKLLYGESGNGSNNAYADYTAVGAWYCAGDGTQTSRSITIKNVIVGDTIVVYAGQHSSGTDGPLIFYYEGQGLAKGQKGSVVIGPGREFQKIEFIAEYSGSYTIWPVREASGNNGKAMYHRVMRIPGAKVSGSIDFGAYTGSDYTVKFINQTTNQEFIVDVREDNSFEQYLAPGYTYLAVLNGAPGYGFAAEGKTITIAKDAKEVKDIKLTVEEKDMYQYTGMIKGLEVGYNTDRLVMTMVPPEDSNADEVKLTIDRETLSFDAYLESNLEYTIQMEGADDYVVKTPLSVKSAVDLSEDIILELKPRYTASGAFIGLDDAKVTDLTFTLLDEKGAEDTNYVYSATIANGGYGYTIQLRDGAYIAKATVSVSGYTTKSHVVVDGADVYKDLMFISAEDTTSLTRVANLYVGYPGKKNNYSTVNAAVKAAKRMNPTKEEERITIHIAPGTYTEQILIEVPYITFTNDEPSKEVILTWYYGIGYKYYSAKDGYYDEASAYDKYEKAEVKDWGTTVRLNAPGFRAENITFENSFNQRIVDAELEDGVESAGDKPERTKDVDVWHSNYKERAAVMYINDKADNAEFYKCKFISNQDTIGTGKAGTHSYFKECLFEGTTDYICGDGDCVFDSCELRWAGQSDKEAGGYITAAQDGAPHGYLFWNCKITANKNRRVTGGYLGRPWGAKAKVIFVNTELESANLIAEAGWTNMSNNEAKNAFFTEFGTTFNGAPVDTSKRLAGTVATENPVTDMTIYFGNWTPLYYNYDETKVVREPVSSEKRSDVPTGTEIALSCDTANAKIYYTINGDDPTGEDSELYTTKFSLGNEEKTVIVKAIAMVGDISSNVAVFEYNVKSPANLIAAPTASIVSGTVEAGTAEAGTVVLLSCATDGAKIYFTIDGSEPKVDNNLLYRGQPILIYETMTIKAIAAKDTNVSTTVTFEYKVTPTITADPRDGTTFPSTGGTVTLKASKGADIYYTTSSTLEGLTDPADESNTKRVKYTGTPIQITEETYIWAVAISSGLTSDALKCHYIVLAEGEIVKPVADPDGSKPVKSGTVVKLTVTDDTIEQIYYTTDGSDPREAGGTRKTYDPITGIVITEAVTIKAVAQKGDKYSEVVTIKYDIDDDNDDNDGSDDKIKVDKDNEVINLGDTTKITVKAANVYVVNKKVSYKVSVTYTPKGGKPQELKEDVHYKVCFVNGSDGMTAGPQKIFVEQVEDPNKKGEPVVTDLGTFKGKSAAVEYELLAKNDKSKTDISKLVKGIDIKTYNYTGEYHTPEITWKTTPEKDENDNEQYMVVYRNNVNAGKASVTVLGLGDYCGSKTLTYTIKPAKLTDITWKTFDATNAKIGSVTKGSATATPVTEGADAFDYKGSPITFNGLTLETETAKLKKAIDYTIDYKKNAQEGTATATIKGVNNYSGSIKVTYKIQIKPFEQEDLDKATVVAERALQGSGVAKIKIGDVTLEAGVDFKPNNKPLQSVTEIAEGDSVSVTVTGLGAYKKAFAKNATVSVTTIGAGKFHIKAGTVVDPAKLAKAKITDVTGKAIKATGSAISEIKRIEISDGVYSNKGILVTAAEGYSFENTNVDCHVATKLGSVAKQDKNAITKEFDGVNTVTLTTKEIVEHIGDKKGQNSGTVVKADEITIVSYKNNNKAGNATVTIQAKDDSPYYGTMNIKFTIKADKKVTDYNTGEEGPATPGSGEGSDTPGSGEGSDTPGSGEDSDTLGSGEDSDTPGSGEGSDTEPTPDPCGNEHTIWLVGDSTVCEFSDNYYYPRYGYGTQIKNYLDSKCTVKNLALSGRSSKSFLGEANYKTLTEGIKEGDVLVIGFGHNDEKNEADRYTNPNGDYQTPGSFANSLYENYVKVAQEKGAQVILCTPIVRRATSNTLSDSNCHITSDATDTAGNSYPGGDYPQAVRDLGKAVNVPVVDLTALTKTLYESVGADETLYMHAWTGSKPASVDNTHLNIYGAKRVAYLFAKELKEKYAKTIDIARHVTNLDTEPSKDKDLVSNSEYKEPEYDSNLKQSALWEDYGIFKGTVFGDVGGASKITTSNFKLEKAADDSMHIAAGVAGNQGKISTADGLAMYYYKVPVGKEFSFSATAKINSITNDGQAGFGLMARDDMYIDTYNNAISSDYVAAGSLGKGTNCFYRRGGALTSGGALTEALEAGKTYDLSIVYSGDGYACTFGNEPTQSGGFDFQLTSVDAEHVYIGMFASRNADITFSDIILIVDGKEIDIMTGEEIAGNAADNTYAVQETSVIQWVKNLFNGWFN